MQTMLDATVLVVALRRLRGGPANHLVTKAIESQLGGFVEGGLLRPSTA